MAGQKESIVGFAVTIQPTPGTFNSPAQADMIPISAPDNGSDSIGADDPTLTGAIWAAPRIFLGRRGRAGATAAMRGPGGASPFAANAWPLGRILQAAGFTEIITAAAVTGTAQANANTAKAILAAGASAVDDFYLGMPIQHANVGTGTFGGMSMIRDYNGTTKVADLMETLAVAIGSGTYTIPPNVTYLLSTGLSVPLLSCSVWRHGVRYNYKDCALSSFAINVPVSTSQQTDVPTVEFAMSGLPAGKADNTSPVLLQSALTPVPSARAGKFAFNGVKLGHQTLRLEFGLTTGAPPNQNFDTGEETYELISGTRNVALDLNQTLVATLDPDTLTDAQTAIPILSSWGLGIGNRFSLGIMNSLLDSFSPSGRNGFVGMSGNAGPADTDKAISLALSW